MIKFYQFYSFKEITLFNFFSEIHVNFNTHTSIYYNIHIKTHDILQSKNP